MTTLERILICSNAFLFFVWLWQAYLLTKASRAASRATGLLEFMRQTNQFADLSEAVLKQNKLNCEVQGELVKDLSTLNTRLDAYNHRLNELTGAVRTKVSRIDNSGVKL